MSGDDTRFTGVVVEDKNGKKQEKIPRVEEDGILLVVPARINGKLFSALIDSGATRCFVTQECCTVAILMTYPTGYISGAGKWSQSSFPWFGAGGTNHIS